MNRRLLESPRCPFCRARHRFELPPRAGAEMVMISRAKPRRHEAALLECSACHNLAIGSTYPGETRPRYYHWSYREPDGTEVIPGETQPIPADWVYHPVRRVWLCPGCTDRLLDRLPRQSQIRLPRNRGSLLLGR